MEHPVHITSRILLAIHLAGDVLVEDERELVESFDVSVRTFRKALRFLEEKGWVVIERSAETPWVLRMAYDPSASRN